jgi:hypothetical protein
MHCYTKNNGRGISACKIQKNLPMHSEDTEGKQCESIALAMKTDQRRGFWSRI